MSTPKSKPIGFKGQKRNTVDMMTQFIVFAAAASATKAIGLDPTKKYALFCDGAGPSDVTVAFTSDSPSAIAAGNATWSDNLSATNVAAAGGFLLKALAGATGVRVTHVKNGAGTDDAEIVKLLGGRFQVRVVEGSEGTGTAIIEVPSGA